MAEEASVLPQYFAGCSAAMGSFALGAVISWSAPLELAIKEGDLGFPVSDTQFVWIGSLIPLGAAIVCIPIGVVIDIIGRKWTMMGLVLPFLIGWLLIIFAQNIEMLLVGRFLLGMCGGAFCVVVPIYTTEIAQTKIRGIMGSLFQVLLTMGMTYGYVVVAYTPMIVANSLCAIVPIVMGILVLFIPESPAYYVQKDKMEEAKKSLQWLRGNKFDISGDLAQMVANDKYAKENKVELKKVLGKKVIQKGLFISISLMLVQQLSGINAIVFYNASIFKAADPSFSEKLANVLMGSIMVITTLLSLLFIDRAGRKILLIISAALMTLCTCCIAYYYLLKVLNPDSAKDLAWLPLSCFCVYLIVYSIGFGAIPWLMMAEIFTEDIKGVCAAVTGISNWGAAFVITNIHLFVSGVIGVAGAFFLYASESALAVIFVIYFVPETKNKTLLEIQAILRGEGEGEE